MAGLDSLGKVAETDVLILGGGVTGLWAAIKAKEHVEKVTIVDKGPHDWGGQASRSGGAMVGVVPPQDRPGQRAASQDLFNEKRIACRALQSRFSKSG